MKKSKYFVLFAAVFAFVVGITGCEVESENHEHTFSKEWTTDEIAHWHAATCEHKTEISDKAAHILGEWKITREATETQEGERQRTCSVCKHVEKDVISKLEHTHTFGDWIVIKESTRYEVGKRERVCSVCKYIDVEPIYIYLNGWELDSSHHWHWESDEYGTSKEVDKAEHVFGKWFIINKVTETEEGLKRKTCSVCDYDYEESISKEHTHIFSEWSNDTVQHYRYALCCEKSESAEHTFGEWTVIKEATKTEEGKKERTCSVCKYVESFIIPLLEHTHDFSKDWTNDETSHWHICNNNSCSEVEEKYAHWWDDGNIMNDYCTKKGEKVYKCLTCGRVKIEEDVVPPRGHSWTEIWQYDETNHWHNCYRCDEVNDKSAHQWIVAKVEKEETCTEEGKKWYKCSVCDEIKLEYPSALGHIYKYEPYKYTYNYVDVYGHKAKCERCNKLIEEYHKWDVITVEPICKDGTYTCSKCGETKTVPAVHVFGDWTVTPATEITEGNTKRDCFRCGYHDSETIPKILDALKKVPSATFAANTEWNPKSEVLAGRKISIRSLYVSRHEVTKGEYKKIIGNFPENMLPYDIDENNRVLKGDAALDNPINNISWYIAIVYCNKLSKKEGLSPCYTINGSTNPDEWGEIPTKSNDEIWDAVECNFDANGYRLPTEVEWEYLARGGNPANGYEYSGGNSADRVAWYIREINGEETRKVEKKEPNELGLYDMSGNVYEWCWDWEGSVSNLTPLEGNDSPVESDNGEKKRAMRGGSIFRCKNSNTSIFTPPCLKVSERKYVVPGCAYCDFGFRVVRTVTE